MCTNFSTSLGTHIVQLKKCFTIKLRQIVCLESYFLCEIDKVFDKMCKLKYWDGFYWENGWKGRKVIKVFCWGNHMVTMFVWWIGVLKVGQKVWIGTKIPSWWRKLCISMILPATCNPRAITSTRSKSKMTTVHTREATYSKKSTRKWETEEIFTFAIHAEH